MVYSHRASALNLALMLGRNTLVSISQNPTRCQVSSINICVKIQMGSLGRSKSITSDVRGEHDLSVLQNIYDELRLVTFGSFCFGTPLKVKNVAKNVTTYSKICTVICQVNYSSSLGMYYVIKLLRGTQDIMRFLQEIRLQYH